MSCPLSAGQAYPAQHAMTCQSCHALGYQPYPLPATLHWLKEWPSKSGDCLTILDQTLPEWTSWDLWSFLEL